MTEYYYRMNNGKQCLLHERRVAILTNSLWQAIRNNRIVLIRQPENLSESDAESYRFKGYDAAIYQHCTDNKGLDSVVRGYASVDNFGYLEQTTPLELSYLTFLNDLLTYGDTLIIEHAISGRTLKTFSILRGA